MTDIIVEITGVGGATNLTALTDTNLTGAVTGQVLTYDAATSKWIPTAAAGVDTLAALTDTNVAGITDGQILEWNLATSKFIAVDNLGGGGAVDSVAGRTGDVVIVKADIADFGTYATTAQGTLADTATQPADNISTLTNDLGFTNDQTGAEIKVAYEAEADTNAFTNLAVSTLASATQPADNISTLTNDAGYITSAAAAPVDSVAGKIGVVTLVKADISDFVETDYATGAEGDLATSALQGITGESVGSLSDVVDTGKINGSILKYNGANWVVGPDPASTTGLDDLTDVVLTTNTDGMVLRTNGVGWVDSFLDYSDVTGTPTIIDWTASSQGTIDSTNLPGLALTDVNTVATEIAQLALTAQEGDVAIRTDLNKTYAHNGGVAGTMADWSELLTPTDVVTSVAGKTGVVTLQEADITDFGTYNNYVHPTGAGNEHIPTGGTVGQILENTASGTAAWVDHEVIASSVTLENTGSATYTTLQDMNDVYHSAGWISGGVLTTTGSGATVDVAAGTGWIKGVNTDTATLYATDWLAATGLAIVDNDLNYIYVEYNAGVPQVTTTTTYRPDNNTNIELGTIYRIGTVQHISYGHRHTVANHAQRMIDRLHETMPFGRAYGAVITETGTRNLAISAGKWWEGLNYYTTGASDTSVADTFRYFYDNGAGGFTEVTGQTQIDNLQYDNGTGTLATLSNSKYNVHWVYIGEDSDVYVIYGTTNGSLTEAQDAMAPTATPGHFEQHARLIGKIIVAKGDSVFTDIISVFTTTLTGSSGIQNVGDDITPQLGGDLDVDGHIITSSTVNADVTITPNGTGNLTITNGDIVLTEAGALVDGRDVGGDGTKLDTIETSATADQTGAEIKVAYEAEADTNAFTDANVTTLGTATQPADNISTLTNDSAFISGYTVTESDVTTHEAALTITKSQVSDFGTYQAVTVNTLQTTDATITVLSTTAIATDEEKILRVRVHGHEDVTDDHIWKTMTFGVKNIAGTASLVGGIDAATGYDAGAGTWTIVAGVSSGNATITITGEAAHTINWKATVELD